MSADNLLPNASFELEFGDSLPTNWGDTHGELTVKLQATGQVPKATPRSEEAGDAVDGERVARIETEESDDGPVGQTAKVEEVNRVAGLQQYQVRGVDDVVDRA